MSQSPYLAVGNSFLLWSRYSNQVIPRWWETTSPSPLQDPTSVSRLSLKIHSVSQPFVSLISTRKALSKICSIDITISKSMPIQQFRSQPITTLFSCGITSAWASQCQGIGMLCEEQPSPCMLRPPMPGRQWGCGGTWGLWWGDAMLERWGCWPT